MSKLYSSSAVIIAAIWAQDSHGDCFVERNSLLTERCKLGEFSRYGIRQEDGMHIP